MTIVLNLYVTPGNLSAWSNIAYYVHIPSAIIKVQELLMKSPLGLGDVKAY